MLDTKELVSYIHEARAVGIKEPEILKQLQVAGWRDDLIAQSMQDADASTRHNKEAIIQVSNLTKRYGTFVAVDGISFEVRRGETFGILGPNGAGKTTTLEMIEGLKKISSGTVLVDGKDVTRQTHEVKSVIGVQL